MVPAIRYPVVLMNYSCKYIIWSKQECSAEHNAQKPEEGWLF